FGGHYADYPETRTTYLQDRTQRVGAAVQFLVYFCTQYGESSWITRIIRWQELSDSSMHIERLIEIRSLTIDRYAPAPASGPHFRIPCNSCISIECMTGGFLRE